jgi:hypothetical protein
VKHADLWQRVDQALTFHEVQCRTLRTDAANATPPAPHFAWQPATARRSQLAEQAAAPPAERPWNKVRERAVAAFSWLGRGRSADSRQPSWVGAG